MLEFAAAGHTATGYLAIPASGAGPGVLVLHAWWGLTDFFTGLCDRLAAAGFVALAPDLYGDGRTAATIEEAERLLAAHNFERTTATVLGAVEHLRQHPAARDKALGVVGFSMGASWALSLSGLKPDDVAAVVTFYGGGEADFAAARAAYLGHYAERDDWEPLEGIRQLEAALRAAGREVTFHRYPGVGHWFFEADRPDAYDAEAARLAWERTVAFLRRRLAME